MIHLASTAPHCTMAKEWHWIILRSNIVHLQTLDTRYMSCHKVVKYAAMGAHRARMSEGAGEGMKGRTDPGMFAYV